MIQICVIVTAINKTRILTMEPLEKMAARGCRASWNQPVLEPCREAPQESQYWKTPIMNIAAQDIFQVGSESSQRDRCALRIPCLFQVVYKFNGPAPPPTRTPLLLCAPQRLGSFYFSVGPDASHHLICQTAFRFNISNPSAHPPSSLRVSPLCVQQTENGEERRRRPNQCIHFPPPPQPSRVAAILH